MDSPPPSTPEKEKASPLKLSRDSVKIKQRRTPNKVIHTTAGDFGSAVQRLTGRPSVTADLPPGGSLTSSLSDQINRSGDDDLMETIVDDMEGVQSWSAPRPTRAVLFSPVISCDESQKFDELDKLPKKIMEFSSSNSDFFSSPYDGLWHGGDNSLFSSHVAQQQVYEFRKDELVQMWMAEGFIEESQAERMEDTGNAYFNSLHKMGFLVPSRCDTRVDFDSVFSVPTYNPGNLLYKVNPVKLSLSELVKTTALVDYFAAVDGNLDGALETTQHLSLNCKEISDMTFGILKNFKRLRTLLLLSGHGSSIKHVPRDLFLSLKDLRTLNLSRTLVSEVPSSIRNVKSLRYLDLSNTPITQLPESIDSLHHVQTIKLRGCAHFLQLPKGTKKLVNLRHIDLDIIRQLRAMPPYIGNLTNLQTLSAFLVGREEGCRIGELKNLNNLKRSTSHFKA